MEPNYVGYNYTPVYHQLQNTGIKPDALPHFSHITSRLPSNQEVTQNVQDVNPTQSMTRDERFAYHFNQFHQQNPQMKHDERYPHIMDQNFPQRSPFLPPMRQFQPMPMHPIWENNFPYPHQYPLGYHPGFMQHPQMGYFQPQDTPPTFSQPSTYDCTVCNKAFTTAAHLKRHMTTRGHLKSSGSSNISERVDTQPIIVKNGDKSYQITFTEVDRIDHTLPELHVPDIDFAEELSNIEPSRFEPAPLFIKSETSPKPVVSSTSISPPTRYEESTNENGEFQCTFCSKCFTKQCYLTQHKKQQHETLNTYKCTRCGKKFSTREILKDHSLRHDSLSKPHRCSQCSKSFIHKTDLKRHEILHTSDLPHKCDQCAKGFIRKDHLFKHLKSHERKLARLQKCYMK